jgi:hypothetical protein
MRVRPASAGYVTRAPLRRRRRSAVVAGKRALRDNLIGQLELLDERQFRNGVVRLLSRVSV